MAGTGHDGRRVERRDGAVGCAGGVTVGVCLEGVAALMAAVADVPAGTLTEPALQRRLGQALRVRASVEELTARLVASVADRDLPRLAGATSTRAWLVGHHAISGSDAARL